MATGLIEQSAPPEASGWKARKENKAGGSSSLDKSALKGPTAKLTHIAGHESSLGRRSTPESTFEQSKGTERTLETERKFSVDLVRRFTDDLRSDLDQLIDMRGDFASKGEFTKFLGDSGHSYYIPMFDRLILSKPGTKGRESGLQINEDALKEFMGTDKGLSLAYEIRQKKFQEQAMAAAVMFAMDPNEPHDETVLEGDATTGKGKPLREAGRWVKKQFITPVGRSYGRDKAEGRNAIVRGSQIALDNRGKVTLILGGASIILGTAGGFMAGPLGVAVGAALPEAAAALYHGTKRGETMRINLSPAVLRAMQEANPAAQEWSRRFNNLDANDYEERDGKVRLVEGIVHRTGLDPRTLAEHLKGTALELKRFRQANGIRREYDRPMDMDWLFDATKNRPKHGTQFEQKVIEKFMQLGGIQDMDGNPSQIEQQIRERGTWHPPQESTDGQIADHDFNGQRHYNVGDPLPVGTRIPPRRILMGKNRLGFAQWRELPAEIVTTPGRTADAEFYGTNSYTNGDILPAGIRIPGYNEQGPLAFDAAGQPIMRLGRNPNFDPDRIDGEGNYERWSKATEKILATEINEAFRSLVEGKTDYYADVFDRISEKKAAVASGERFEAEARRRKKEYDKLEEEIDHFDNKKTKASKYMSETAVHIRQIEQAQERQRRAYSKVSDEHGNPFTNANDVRQALAAVNEPGNTTTIIIGGEKIKSLHDEKLQLEETLRQNRETTLEPYRRQVADAMTEKASATREASRIRSQINLLNQQINLLTRPNTRGVDPATMQTEFTRLQNEIASFEIERANAEDRATAADLREQTTRQQYTQVESDMNRTQDEIRKQVEARIQRQQEQVNKILGTLNEEEARIDDLRSEDIVKEGEFSRKDFAVEVLNLEKGRREIEARIVPDDPSTAAISLYQLQTLSFQQLLTLINNHHQSYSDYGWPASENSSIENRQKLLYAMTEAKAARNDVIDNPGDEFTTARQTWGFGDVDLVTYTAQEIHAMMLDRRAGVSSAPMSIGEIKAAKTAAQRRFDARNGAMLVTINDLKKRKEAFDLTEEKFKEQGLTTPQLDAIEIAVSRYEPISDKLMDELQTDAELATFLSGDLASTNPELFTPGERASYTVPGGTATKEHSIAYINVMNLIFNHRAASESNVVYEGKLGNDAAFQRNSELLSEEMLSRMLVNRLRVSTLSTTLGGVLTDAQNQLGEDFRPALTEFITEDIIMDYLSKAVDRYS